MHLQVAKRATETTDECFPTYRGAVEACLAVIWVHCDSCVSLDDTEIRNGMFVNVVLPLSRKKCHRLLIMCPDNTSPKREQSIGLSCRLGNVNQFSVSLKHFTRSRCCPCCTTNALAPRRGTGRRSRVPTSIHSIISNDAVRSCLTSAMTQ